MNLIFKVVFICFFNLSKAEIKFHIFYKEELDKNPHSLETISYKLLKNVSFKKDVNYLVVPWWLIFHPNNLIDKKKINVKLDGGFTVCHLPDYELIIPLLKDVGIDILFTNNPKNKKYEGIKVLSIPHEARNGIAPHYNKDIFYSFIGSLTHEIRKKIFNIEHPLDSIVLERNEFHFAMKNLINKAIEKEEYQDILSRSRFSLCPRGVGTGSYRFWESLQAGAIPVIISDEYLFPEGYQWQSCTIKVSEKDVKNIPEILKKIPLETELELRKNCLKAYELFSGDNLLKGIRHYYE